MTPLFDIRLADSEAEIRAAQQLRYQVFVKELGGDGPLVDHEAMIEADVYDGVCQHLLLLDHARGDSLDTQVVGVYRVMTDIGAQQRGGYYSATEFNLAPLLNSGRRLMEMGRSCLLPEYRGGMAMPYLWQGLSQMVDDSGADVVFGVASFHGVDLAQLGAPLSYLHAMHPAPSDLRPVSLQGKYDHPDDPAGIDRIAALRQIPALIKAYLRLGGGIGDGAFVDQAFKTTDVCIVLAMETLNPRTKAIYQMAGRL